MPGSNYTYITTATTTSIFGTAIKRVNLLGISVNKATTGTISVQSGSTVIGVIAASSAAGMYFLSSFGVEVASLTIVNSATEDFTVFWNNL